MEQVFTKVEELAQNLKEYVNNRADQIKLTSAEKTAKIMSYLIAVGVVAMLIVFFMLFAAVALSIYMGSVFGALHWGFLFTGGLLLMLAFLLWAFRSSLLQYPIMNALLNQLFKQEEEEDEED